MVFCNNIRVIIVIYKRTNQITQIHAFPDCSVSYEFLKQYELFSNMNLFKPFLANLPMWMKLTFQLLHSWVVFFILWTSRVPAMVCDLEGVFNITWLSQIYEDEHHFYWPTLRLTSCCLYSSHLQRQWTFQSDTFSQSVR